MSRARRSLHWRGVRQHSIKWNDRSWPVVLALGARKARQGEFLLRGAVRGTRGSLGGGRSSRSSSSSSRSSSSSQQQQPAAAAASARGSHDYASSIASRRAKNAAPDSAPTQLRWEEGQSWNGGDSLAAGAGWLDNGGGLSAPPRVSVKLLFWDGAGRGRWGPLAR